MEQQIPNKRQECDFNIMHDGEKYHVFEKWITPESKIAYYEGYRIYQGIRINKTFTPSKIDGASEGL